MGTNLKYKFIAGLVIGISCSTVQAGTGTDEKFMPTYNLAVIEDRGGQSTSSYMPKKNSNAKQQVQARFEKQHNMLKNPYLPVITKNMTVGPISDSEAKEIRYEMLQKALFIVGYDPVSMNWMRQNKELLSEKGAIGLVVNIETKEQLAEMRNIVGEEVILQPTPGDSLAEHVNIRHYPFYVDNQGVLR